MKRSFALDFWAEQQPKKIAIHAGEYSISYGELSELTSRLAGALRKQGLKPRDSLLIYMPNSIEFAVVFYAAARLELDIIPANPLFKVVEIRQLIQQIRPKLAFVADNVQMQFLHSVDDTLPVLCASMHDVIFQEMLESKECIQSFPEDLSNACIVVSTSGSTGKLKFVARPYLSQIIPATLYLRALRVTVEDILMTPLPLTQQFGMAALLGGCIAGCTVIIPAQFDAETVLSLIEQYHVTVQYGVPTMYIKEMASYEATNPKPTLSSLRTGIIAGASGAADLFRWFEHALNCRLLNCYGTTEVAGVSMVDYDDLPQARYHTCGRVLQSASIAILDENGIPQPNGTAGEIVCETPWVMREYIGEPELTAQVLDAHGRFWTGDIGILDQNGFLTICGRKKDLIIRCGYNIFPAEVELQLLKHPDILEACVIGSEDSVLGERICAFIKLKMDAKRVKKKSSKSSSYILPSINCQILSFLQMRFPNCPTESMIIKLWLSSWARKTIRRLCVRCDWKHMTRIDSFYTLSIYGRTRSVVYLYHFVNRIYLWHCEYKEMRLFFPRIVCHRQNCEKRVIET